MQVWRDRRKVKDKRREAAIEVRGKEEVVVVVVGCYFNTSVVCSSGPAGKRGMEL